MAKLLASLSFACLLTFGAGCLGDAAPAGAADQAVPLGEPAAPAPEAPATVDPPPECPKGGRSNHGTSTEIAGHYIVSPEGSHLAVYYQESNGCNGWQTEEAWPHNPDTKVVEIPYPISPAGPKV